MSLNDLSRLSVDPARGILFADEASPSNNWQSKGLSWIALSDMSEELSCHSSRQSAGESSLGGAVRAYAGARTPS